MQELIEQIKTNAGITDEQALKTLQTIQDYIKAKLPPMMSGMVDNFLGMGEKHDDDFLDGK
jgi:hypothetical protein